MKKLFALTLALLMVLSLVTGCGGSGNEQKETEATQATQGGSDTPTEATPAEPEMLDIVRVGVTAWPASMDPVTKMGWTQTRILNQIYDTLLYCEDDATISSYICESWDRIDEYTTEYKLKEGITFHNGYPLTAEDIKFTLDRVLFDDTGYVDPNVTAVVNTIESVEVVDELTVRIKTSIPDPIIYDRLASNLGVYIVSKQYIEEVGNEQFGIAPVGTGPFKMDSITPENMMLSYYEGYYGEKPAMKQMEYRYFSEEMAMVTSLITGEIDLANNMTPTAATMLEGKAGLQLFSQPYSTSHMLRIKTHDAITADKKLRQAMSLAIDRQLLVDTLWEGYASIPNGYNYEEFGQYYVADYPTYKYDPELAKQLVAESSYDGSVISYQLIPGYYAMGAEAAEAIVDMWKQVGINAQVEYVEAIKPATITDMANWSNGLRFSDPLGGLWALWGEGTAVQKDLWEAPARFNELGNMIMTESDVEKRNEYYAEMMAIWDDEIPGTILYCPDMIWCVRDGLEWDYNPGKAVNFRADHLRVVE